MALAGDRAALGGALRYLFVSLSGSLLYLMGVALLYGGYGTVDLVLLAERMTGEPHSQVALALMTGGLMMKSALFPVHFWLPPAHSSAPAPVSAVLSALVVKAGFYVLLRLWFEVFDGDVSFGAAQFMGVLGAAAILWGSLQALIQERLKLLVAYSTVAQLGYLFLLFPLAVGTGQRGMLWTGGLMFLLSHAAAKAAMFLAAGSIQRAAGHDRIEQLGGITHVLPVSAFAIGLAGISLVGLPPSAGFVGKWLLLGSSLEQGQWWWVAVILIGSLLAAAYMIRLLSHAFAGAPETGALRRVSGGMEWSALALALLSFALGFAATGPARMLENVLHEGRRPLSFEAALLLGILLSSFLTGCVIFFLREESHRLRTGLNLAGAGLKLVLVLALLWGVLQGRSYEWSMTMAPGIVFALGADANSVLFVALSSVLWFWTTLYAVGYLEDSPHRSRFFGFFSLCVTATVGIALSANLVTFLTFYELLTVSTFPAGGSSRHPGVHARRQGVSRLHVRGWRGAPAGGGLAAEHCRPGGLQRRRGPVRDSCGAPDRAQVHLPSLRRRAGCEGRPGTAPRLAPPGDGGTSTGERPVARGGGGEGRRIRPGPVGLRCLRRRNGA